MGLTRLEPLADGLISFSLARVPAEWLLRIRWLWCVHLPTLLIYMLPLLVLFQFVSSTRDSSSPEFQVETLRSLCRRLSAERGLPIEPDQELAGMPVYVERRSMTLDRTLAAVAFGFRASVVKTKSKIRITRTQNDLRNMLGETRQYWRQHLNSWFEEANRQRKDAARFGSSLDQYNHYQELVNRQLTALSGRSGTALVNVTVCPMDLTPIGFLYSQILQGIGVDRLVDTRPEHRRIWSNRPQQSQLLCPSGDILLSRYFEDEKRFLKQSHSESLIREPRFFTLKQVGGTYFTLKVYDSTGSIIEQYGGPPFDFPMAGPILVTPTSVARSLATKVTEWSPLDKQTNEVLPFLTQY